MTSYRFPEAMGDVVEEGDFDDHAAALAWARDGDHDEDVQRASLRRLCLSQAIAHPAPMLTLETGSASRMSGL